MAKKQLMTAPPNPHNVPNRDIMQRLNFLYQASTWLSSLPTTQCQATQPTTRPIKPSDRKREKKQRGKASVVTPTYLSRSYVSSMKAIGRKTVVKLDPSVKRTICKGCDSLLIPGMTATVRSGSLSSHGKSVRLSCLNCKTTRRLPAPPVHVSQDVSDSLPDPESTTRVDGTGTEGKRRKRPKKKVVHNRPFFERPEHILFRGNEIMVKTDDRFSGETTAQEAEPVNMEIDAVSR